MEKKNVTEVVIGGKIYKLGGYESEDYLHQVASYLNNRITELRSLEGYHRLPSAQKSLMLDLNTADDYFKAKKQVERLEADLSQKDRELYEIRHELVSAEVKLEESQKQITSLKEEADDYLKRIALLEARLSRPGEGTGNQAQDLPDQKGKE
jgi:cell division protein ZapA